MSTSAYIGRMSDEGYKTRRLNFDGDPETVMAALNQILQRDGFELAADTILDHSEWRSLDPSALEQTASEETATVIGYGDIYLPDDMVPEDEDWSAVSITQLDEYAYLIDVEREVVMYFDTDGELTEWKLGDDVPSSRTDE